MYNIIRRRGGGERKKTKMLNIKKKIKVGQHWMRKWDLHHLFKNMLIYHHHHRSESSLGVRVISRKNSQKVFSSRAQYISINYFKNADHLQQIYSNFLSLSLSRIVKKDF
jgi:hypothetical protein